MNILETKEAQQNPKELLEIVVLQRNALIKELMYAIEALKTIELLQANGNKVDCADLIKRFESALK